MHDPMFTLPRVAIRPAMATALKPPASSFVRVAGIRHRARYITSAADAAQHMLQNFRGKTKTCRQVLDGHQLQKLSLTLNRKSLHPGLDVSLEPPPPGTPLPPGYHLAYFSPAAVEEDLGADGTDKTFNAPAPFARRMWAGGEMSWVEGVPLRVGEEVEERTRLVDASPKRRRRDGSEMVLVAVEKEFWGPSGLALVDKRSWIFRPPPTVEALEPGARTEEDAAPIRAGTGAAGRLSTVEDGKVGDMPRRKLTWSPVALFRFSALTFNAHMIHYNEDWTRNVEGHPAVVVHGPLNLIATMDFWRDMYSSSQPQQPRRVIYRALSPVYAGQEYYIETKNFQSIESWNINIISQSNKILESKIII